MILLDQRKFRAEPVARPNIGKAVQDFVIVAALLILKLAAWEPENCKFGAVVASDKLIKTVIIGDRESSEGRNIHSHNNLPA